MSIRKLIDIEDNKAKKALSEYYIVSKERMDNIVACFEASTQRMVELNEIIKKQQLEIENLIKLITVEC